MHKMTHQKVRAEEKWGAIPMIPETINDVYEIVSNSNFERKENLLEILERWKSGDFSRTDEDHNYFGPSKAVRSAKRMELCLKMKKRNLSKITLNKKVQAPV